MMSENLSKANLRAANSSRKGLYFISVAEVLLEAKVMGCSRDTTFPPGRLVVTLCDNTPAKESVDPSVVKMKGVPSYCGAESTGSEISWALSVKKVLVCS